MSEKRPQSQIDAEATAWVVRMHSDQVTLDDEQTFAAWLRETPANRTAYARQETLWAGIGRLREDDAALADLASLREKRAHPLTSRRGLLAASFTGAAIVTGIGGWVGYEAFFASQAYATEIGEQRRVVLSDGSAITLNTASTVRLRFDERERRIWLERGQAFFAVAHDPARPFRVFAGDDEIRATGTAFEVRLDGAVARVTLEEGSVALYRGARQMSELTAAVERRPDAVLEAGQQGVVAPTGEIEIAVVDTRRTGAWRFGQMVLESEPLGAAITEINRYNARRIVLADPSLETMAVNGVFQTGRPEAFVETLTAAFPIDVAREDESAIYLERRHLD